MIKWWYILMEVCFPWLIRLVMLASAAVLALTAALLVLSLRAPITTRSTPALAWIAAAAPIPAP